MSTGRPADGRSLPCTKLPCVLCWELGAGRAGGSPAAPAQQGRAWGEAPGSFPPPARFRAALGRLRAGGPHTPGPSCGPHLPPGGCGCVHLCAPCRRCSYGPPGADIPSRVAVTEATLSAPWGLGGWGDKFAAGVPPGPAGSLPLLGTPPLPSRTRPRVTDPVSLLPISPILSARRPASLGPGQLPAGALRPASPRQVRPWPLVAVSSDAGLLTACPQGGCRPLPGHLGPVTRLLTDACLATPASAPSPKASETRAPAWGKKKLTRLNH